MILGFRNFWSLDDLGEFRGEFERKEKAEELNLADNCVVVVLLALLLPTLACCVLKID